MKPVILDTDVVSFLFKRDTRADLYVERLRDRQLLISFMTEAELEQWVLLSGWRLKRIEWLHLYLQRFVVVASSSDLSKKWAEVMVAARATGRRMDSADAWVAATALLYDAVLLTHNTKDYLGVPGLRLTD
ncbi:MAG TPA: PIN domain-containing protein [Bryobacteraceae bacterium]|nr:PIN domain-containing protein [Bryobacteraceae bacterium]